MTSAASDRVRFGFGLGPRLPNILENLDEWAELAESLGCELIGTGDVPSLYYDPYVMLTMVAQRTKKAQLSATVSPPFIRHPAQLATGMATLNMVSGGRAMIGLGTGSDWPHVGLAPAKLKPFLEYALAVRALARGESVEYDGVLLEPKWDAGPVPLLLAAEGLRTLEEAGKHADAVLVGNSPTVGRVTHSMARLKAGAETAGRTLADLDVWHMVRIHVSTSREQGIEEQGFYAARYIYHAYSSDVKMATRGLTIPEELRDAVAAYMGEYDEHQAHLLGTTYGIELLRKHGIAEWAADQFLVTGSHDDVVAQLRKLIEAGASSFLIAQMTPQYMETTRQIGAVFAELQ